MKINILKNSLLILGVVTLMYNCSNDVVNETSTSDSMMTELEIRSIKGTYVQEDQMGRPAINTVFVGSNQKDNFNVTIPSEMVDTYQASFQDRLLALNPGYTTNALGQDAAAFTTFLAKDVLTASLTGTTTFFDGINVLTGRTLADDVINVELLLIFGGPDFSENPALTNDFVNENDVAFSDSFPYLATPW